MRGRRPADHILRPPSAALHRHLEAAVERHRQGAKAVGVAMKAK
jgi:hypothetical protein